LAGHAWFLLDLADVPDPSFLWEFVHYDGESFRKEQVPRKSFRNQRNSSDFTTFRGNRFKTCSIIPRSGQTPEIVMRTTPCRPGLAVNGKTFRKMVNRSENSQVLENHSKKTARSSASLMVFRRRCVNATLLPANSAL
jgi:hypothetical protein